MADRKEAVANEERQATAFSSVIRALEAEVETLTLERDDTAERLAIVEKKLSRRMLQQATQQHRGSVEAMAIQQAIQRQVADGGGDAEAHGPPTIRNLAFAQAAEDKLRSGGGGGGSSSSGGGQSHALSGRSLKKSTQKATTKVVGGLRRALSFEKTPRKTPQDGEEVREGDAQQHGGATLHRAAGGGGDGGSDGGSIDSALSAAWLPGAAKSPPDGSAHGCAEAAASRSGAGGGGGSSSLSSVRSSLPALVPRVYNPKCESRRSRLLTCHSLQTIPPTRTRTYRAHHPPTCTHARKNCR